jgi:hypothetical protein
MRIELLTFIILLVDLIPVAFSASCSHRRNVPDKNRYVIRLENPLIEVRPVTIGIRYEVVEAALK